MSEPEKDITEQQKKAAAFLTRPRIPFELKSPEKLAAEAQAAAHEKATLDAEALANAQRGDLMPDGTIFAGLSPYTGQPMFAMPADAGVTMTFNEAAQYAKKLNTEHTLGHNDWRVPTKAELNVLFQNRDKGALAGTFNVTGSDPAGCYWSSTPYYDSGASTQRFNDGNQAYNYRDNDSSVRCVR